MQRRLWLLAFVLLLPSVFAAEQCTSSHSLLKQKINAEILFLNYRAEARLIVMDAARNASQGNMSALQGILEQFAYVRDHATDAATALDADLIEERESELDSLIIKFRVAISNQDAIALRKASLDALHIQEEHLLYLRRRAYQARKELFLAEFDQSRCMFTIVIDGLNEQQYNKRRLSDQLRRVGELRSTLESAIDDAHQQCLDTPLFKCTRDKANDLVSLERIIQENFRQIKSDINSTGISDREQQSLKTLRSNIDLLANQINGTWAVPPDRLQSRISQLYLDLNHANTQYTGGNYDSVDKALQVLQNDYTQAAALYERLRRTEGAT